MLSSARFVAVQDLRHMLRQRETLLWTFLFPILFFFFIGTVAGGGGFGPQGPTPVLVERQGDPGWLYPHLRARLEEADIRVVEADTVETPERYSRRLQVPAAMTDSVLEGTKVTLTLARRRAGIGATYDGVRLRRALYTVAADLAVAGASQGRPDSAAVAALLGETSPVTLEVRTAGLRATIPSGFEQAVPGTMVMFTLLVLLTSGAVLLVLEREEGLLRRLAAAPMSRGSIVLGKWGARLALGAVQIGFAMVAGRVLFGVGWGPDPGMVIVVLAAYGALCAVLALLLGSLARTPGQAVGVGVLAANVLGALGGCWWPIEITPDWMQKLALFLPTGWAMDALHKLVSFEAGPASALPHLAVLTVAAILAAGAATRVFRFQ